MKEREHLIGSVIEVDLVAEAIAAHVAFLDNAEVATARKLHLEGEDAPVDPFADFSNAERARLDPAGAPGGALPDGGLRGRSAGMEELLHRKIPIDGIPGGYIAVVDYMGTDMSLIDAARASFGTKARRGSKARTRAMNLRLARYLFDHDHGSPSEAMSLRMVCVVPMAVFGHLVRYRSGSSLNVTSTRYVEHDVEDETAFYLPNREDLRRQHRSAKQCGGDFLDDATAAAVHDVMTECLARIAGAYKRILDLGLSREQARFLLPDARMVSFSWVLNIRSLLHICKQRLAMPAMAETRATAAVLFYIFRQWLPDTYMAIMATKQFLPSVSREDLSNIGRLASIRVGMPGDRGSA